MSLPDGPYDVVYVHTDIPEGMTIAQWRRARATVARTVPARRHRSLVSRAGRLAALARWPRPAAARIRRSSRSAGRPVGSHL